MANKLTIDDILKEQEPVSDLSIDVSFTCDDILKERENIESDEDDFGDPFEEDEIQEEISDTKPSKVSDTFKSRSTFEIGRQQSNMEARRAFRIKDTVLKPQTLQKSMTYVQLSLVTAAFDPHNKAAKGVGLPTCIYSTSSKYLAIGTTFSNIALFEVGSRDYKILKDTDKKQTLTGNPISIAMSDDSKWLIAGYECGSIGLWDLPSLSLVKTVPNTIPESPTIIKLLFWKGNTDFLSLDSSGNILLHTIQKYVWTSIRSRKLFSSGSLLYHDAKVTRLENGKIILALANVDFVFLVILQPTIEVITKITRPNEISQMKIPNIEFGKSKNMDTVSDILSVSWGKSIFIYKYNSLNRPDKVFELNRQYDWIEPIFNMQMLAFNNLLVIDNKNTFKILNITQDIDKNAIKHEITLDFDLIPQRIMKDKSGDFIKNFTNRVSKCTQDFKQIFLLMKGSVTRGRLHSWTDFIRYLIKQKQWDQILKASTEIFFGRLDIFSEKVVITPNTVLLFNELLVVYLKSRLDDLNDKQLTTLQARQIRQQILDTVIEFCLQLQLNDHLFNRVFDLLNTEYNLSDQFMESMCPFIELDMIKIIPNKTVARSIIEYYALHRIDLVDRLITSLQFESIDYLSTIQVCSRSKLYPSLMHISQLFGDFLQPLNEIISDCKMLSDEGYSEQKLRFYQTLIYKYIISTINGKTLTGTRLNRGLQEIGIRRVFVWFVDPINSEYLITENSNNYFNGLAEVLTQQTVCEISDTIVDRVDILGYVMDVMLLALSKLNKEFYHEDFSECLMIISRIWDLDIPALAYCLQHYKSTVDHSVLAKFVNKNFSKLIELPLWKTIVKKFPPQIQGQVLCREGNYENAIKIYKSLHDQACLKRLFEFTPEQPFLTYLYQFLELDVNLAATCLYQKFCADTIDQAVHNLPNDILKYEFVRKLIMLDQINDIRWRESTTLFYLESMCKFRKEKRVLYELQRRDFDILKALEVVKKYNLKWCQAYLRESHLDLDLALTIYGQIYEKTFKHEFKQVLRYIFVNGRELKRIFQDMMRVIVKLNYQSKQVKQLCQIVLSPLKAEGMKKGKGIVAKQISDISKKKGDHKQFVNVFSELIEKTLQTASKVLTTEQIRLLIEDYKPVFEQCLLINLYCQTLVGLHRDLKITLDTQKIMLGDISDNFKKMMQVKSTAVSGGQFCDICLETLNGGNATVFSCGCCVHQMCCPANPQECPACKLQKQSSNNDKLRRMLRPNPPSRKKDLRKSSWAPDTGHTYQYLSCDAAISKQSDQLVDMLMTDVMLRQTFDQIHNF